MPKLNLRTAVRIKTAGGEIARLKGSGFAWTAPVGYTVPASAFTARDGAILFQGHSLVDNRLMHAFRSWNEQASVTADVQQTVIIGAPSWYIWDHSTEATGVDSRAYLVTPGVDAFVYAEGGPLDATGGTAVSPALPIDYGNRWSQLAWANGARPLLYSIWPYTNTGSSEYQTAFPSDPYKEMTDWRAKIDTLRPDYARIVGYVHARTPEGAAPFRLVPADALMAILYDTCLAGNLIGVSASQAGFYAAMFTDNIHLTVYGWYAVACLHYACVYGQSPVGLSTVWEDDFEGLYSPMPTGPQAAQLQAIAWAVAQADPLGPWGAQIPDDPYAETGGGAAAEWWTPATSPQIIGPAADTAVTQGTLAWAYRWTGTELSASPPTPRMFTSDQFSFVEIAGGDDTTGRGIGSSLVNSSWGSITMANQGGYNNWLMPDVTHNFVLVWTSAGTLSGGMTCQLWWNGVLVRGSTSALSNVGMQGTVMFGNYGGAIVNPGETQGWWYSNDTAMDPAVLFADLFDGTSGLRDLAAPVTISGTTPDVVQIGP